MANYPTNEERTAEYLKRFDREKTLKYLIKSMAPVIFDVGANVGATLEEFKTWWPEATVHCFEPQQECWEALAQRASRYGNKAVVNRFAVGNRNDTGATFYSHDISNGISGFNKVNLGSLDSIQLQKASQGSAQTVSEYVQTFNHERKVPIARADEYMSSSGVTHLDLLKIDTQGYEPEVLAGFGAQLANIDVVITELMFYDYYERSLSFSDIEKYLLPAGFQLYDISHIAKNPMNGRTDWVDVVYVHERIRKRA